MLYSVLYSSPRRTVYAFVWSTCLLNELVVRSDHDVASCSEHTKGRTSSLDSDPPSSVPPACSPASLLPAPQVLSARPSTVASPHARPACRPASRSPATTAPPSARSPHAFLARTLPEHVVLVVYQSARTPLGSSSRRKGKQRRGLWAWGCRRRRGDRGSVLCR